MEVIIPQPRPRVVIGFDGSKLTEAMVVMRERMEQLRVVIGEVTQRWTTLWSDVLDTHRDEDLALTAFIADGGWPEYIRQWEEAYEIDPPTHGADPFEEF